MWLKIFNSKLDRKIIIWMISIVLAIIAITGTVMVVGERNNLVMFERIFEETMAKEHDFTKETLSAREDQNNENLLASLQDKGDALLELMTAIGIEPMQNSDVDTLARYAHIISKNKDVAYAHYLDEKGNILTHSLPEPADINNLMNITSPMELAGAKSGAVKIGLSKKNIDKQMLYSQNIAIQDAAMRQEETSDSLRMLEKKIRHTIQKRVIFLILLSAITFFAVVSIMATVLNRNIISRVVKLHKTSEKIMAGNLDARIGTPAVPCWRELKCENKDCPARAQKDTPCWYMVGTMGKGVIQGSCAEKIGDCRKCAVYKSYAGDEIQQLGETINYMASDLKASRDRIVRAEKLSAIGQLASSVAHELRNPLGVMKNAIYYLNMLELGKDNPDIKENLDIVSGEIENSNKIISDLLEFSRVRQPALRPEDINSIIKETLHRINAPANKKVITELGENLPQIPVDALQIQQVFYNLATNAIQAMDKEGILTVSSCVAHDKNIVISFKDTGCGIPKENLQKIFEPLFSTKTKGTGLGLSVITTIVESHKGKIEVESEAGKGSVFTIKLPTNS